MNGLGFGDRLQVKRSRPVDILYQNVRGLRTKTTKFMALLLSSSSDLFAITETGCNASIQDAELVPSGFSIIRCDRTDGRKQGGALLVATPRFELRQVQCGDVNLNNHQFELVGATVHLYNKFLFACFVLYIPPQANEDEYMVMFNLIEAFSVKYNGKLIVFGDFTLFSSTENVRL